MKQVAVADFASLCCEAQAKPATAMSKIMTGYIILVLNISA